MQVEGDDDLFLMEEEQLIQKLIFGNYYNFFKIIVTERHIHLTCFWSLVDKL